MIHDNHITSYVVDFEQKTLVIKTKFPHSEPPEDTDVVFTGYLAHSFENEMPYSIIFDIEEYPAGLQEKQRWSWPIFYKTKRVTELVKFLRVNGYKVFEVNASIGLSGWIFAKQMEFVRHE